MTITPFQFLLLALATYRLALMISSEAGPFWMFKHLRRFVKREAPKKTHMDDGIECLFCVSAQFGIVIAITAYFFLGNPIYDVSILALALSGSAIIIHHAFTEGFKK